MLIDLKFNRHFAIQARASLHNIIHTPAIICRRSLLCIISYNAYEYQTVCCVISLNLPKCCLTMSGKTKEKRKELSLSDKVYMCKINFTCTMYILCVIISYVSYVYHIYKYIYVPSMVVMIKCMCHQWSLWYVMILHVFSIKTIPLLRPGVDRGTIIKILW